MMVQEDGDRLAICQICAKPTATQDLIEAQCSKPECGLSCAHLECAQELLKKRVKTHWCSNSRGGGKHMANVINRPHQELKGHKCWVGMLGQSLLFSPTCDGHVVMAAIVKAKKKDAPVVSPQPAFKPQSKKNKAAAARKQAAPAGPAGGGVSAVGKKRELEAVPLIIKQNRLGVAEPVQNPGEKEKPHCLTMCRHMLTRGDCPLGDCDYAHNQADIEANELKMRETKQLQKAIKASKRKNARRQAAAGSADDTWEDAGSSIDTASYFGGESSAAWEAASHVDISSPNPVKFAPIAGHELAGQRSFAFNDFHQAGSLFSTNTIQALTRGKLNACISTLSAMGFSFDDCKAAANATGGVQDAAIELLTSGEDKSTWSVMPPNVSNEVERARQLMLSLNVSQNQMEEALRHNHGSFKLTEQALKAQLPNPAPAAPSPRPQPTMPTPSTSPPLPRPQPVAQAGQWDDDNEGDNPDFTPIWDAEEEALGVEAVATAPPPLPVAPAPPPAPPAQLPARFATIAPHVQLGTVAAGNAPAAGLSTGHEVQYASAGSGLVAQVPPVMQTGGAAGSAVDPEYAELLDLLLA